MTKRDWELLDKQFAYLRPAPRYGSLKLAATIATLFAGLAVSSTAILHGPNSTEIIAAKSALPIVLAAYEPGRRAN
jgi:hypothetical protein